MQSGMVSKKNTNLPTKPVETEQDRQIAALIQQNVELSEAIDFLIVALLEG